MSELIKKAEFYLCRHALTRPYKLSFGDVTVFNTIYVVLQSADKIGIGEITPLPGYGSETVETAIRALREMSAHLQGKDSLDLSSEISRLYSRENPFAVSGVVCAIELLNYYERYFHHRQIRIPLTANLELSPTVGGDLERLIGDGYRTFKIKVGRDVIRELDLILNEVMTYLPKGCSLRFDANKALSYGDAVLISKELARHPQVEYLEQPFQETALGESRKLHEETGISIMLDESVYTEQDVSDAGEQKACNVIKLKLFKHGGIEKTITVGKKATSLGLGLRLGNGVQSEWGCFLEGMIFKELNMKFSGEMNGFLKQKERYLNDALEFNSGCVLINSAGFDQEAFYRKIRKRSESLGL